MYFPKLFQDICEIKMPLVGTGLAWKTINRHCIVSLGHVTFKEYMCRKMHSIYGQACHNYAFATN
jgi:hypothetical protein